MKNLTSVFGNIIAIFFTTGKDGITQSEFARRSGENKQKKDKFTSLMSDATAGFFTKTITVMGGANIGERELNVITIEQNDIDGYSAVAEGDAEISSLGLAMKVHKSIEARIEKDDLKEFLEIKAPKEVERKPYPQKPDMPDAPDSILVKKSMQSFMDINNIDDLVLAMGEKLIARFDFDFFTKANQLNSKAAVLGKLLSESGSFMRKLGAKVPATNQEIIPTGVMLEEWARTYSDEELKGFEDKRIELVAVYDETQKELNSFKKRIKDEARALELEQQKEYAGKLTDYRKALNDYQAEIRDIDAKFKKDMEDYRLLTEKVIAAENQLRTLLGQELYALKLRTK